MGYIIRWLSVFLEIFLLFNFVVAVVFQAYTALTPVFRRRAALEAEAWSKPQVCAVVAWKKVLWPSAFNACASPWQGACRG